MISVSEQHREQVLIMVAPRFPFAPIPGLIFPFEAIVVTCPSAGQVLEMAKEQNCYLALSHGMPILNQIVTGLAINEKATAGVFLRGERRLKIVDILSDAGDGYVVAEAEYADFYSRSTSKPLNEVQRILLKTTQGLCAELSKIAKAPIFRETTFGSFDFLGVFADQASGDIIIYLVQQRRLEAFFSIVDQEIFLGELNINRRVRILQEIIKEIIEVLKGTKGEVNSAVAAEKDSYTEWQEKIAELHLPEDVNKKVMAEVNRLRYLQPGHHEYGGVIKYLEMIESVPWNKATQDNLDIDAAQKILENDHAYLEKQKQRILEYLSVKKLKPDYGEQILCFIGPPGTGKTSLGQSIARALGRKFVRRSLGGMHDETEIRGHRRTYVGALPGQIIQGLIDAGVNNPVFMLDEIDKVGNVTGISGNPMSALLEVLDPKQNYSFRDNYLDLPFDLSNVLFIATGNAAETIHPALFDRMEVIPTEAYTTLEKMHIAQKHLLPAQIVAVGLNAEQIVITPDAMENIARFYTQETGVRQMEREIATLCRRVAVEVARGDNGPHEITAENLHQFLGIRKYSERCLEANLPPGVAIGLAVSSLGEGHILYIEAKECPLKFVGPETKGMLCTGSLRDVMFESALVARTRVAAYLSHLSNAIDETGIHLHIPSGAVPKDGPSAGVAIAVALVSLLKNEPVKEKIAFTGEITLRGAVLPVGGIKQKVIGAKIAGIKEVVMPADNEKDFDEVHPDFKAGLKVYFVKNIEEVFDIAFAKKAKKERKKR